MGVVGVLGVGVLAVPAASGTTDTVTTCASSGPGSLPAVVAAAGAGDTVSFALSPPCSTITVPTPVDIGLNLSIDGPGAGVLAVASDSGDVFDVSANVTAATISGLTVEDSTVGIDNAGTLAVTGTTVTENGSNAGGGIVNTGTVTVTDATLSQNTVGVGDGLGGGGLSNDKGTATVTDSLVSDNAAANGANGGGLYNHDGSLSITDTTVTANSTGTGDGGGIYNDGGTVTITDSSLLHNIATDGAGGGLDNAKGTANVADTTLSGNNAYYSSDGGGIANAATLTVTNSTLAHNAARYGGGVGGNLFTSGTSTVSATIFSGGIPDDCDGPLVDGGYSLADDSSCSLTATTDQPDTAAGLDPAGPQDNGGDTETIGLEPSSAAVSAVSSATLCSTPDQRGVARPTPCDTGAVQFTEPPPAITSPDSASGTVGTAFSFDVTTTGSPPPTIKKKGRLPKGLRLGPPAHGSRTIVGTPGKAGVYPLTLEAFFGSGQAKIVVTEPFTITVDPAG